MQSQCQQTRRKHRLPFQVSPFVTVHVDWLAKAAQLPGRAFQCAFVLAYLASRTGSTSVSVRRYTMSRFGLSRDSFGDSLSRLADAGLVVADRKRGRPALVRLIACETRLPLALEAVDVP